MLLWHGFYFFWYILFMKANNNENQEKPVIVRAKTIGYCMGVRRAVESAYMALNAFPEKNVWTLGPLIHNKRTLDSLEEKGVKILEETELGNLGCDDVVIIRAHGVAPETARVLKKQGCTTIDATCPRVMRNQKKASVLAKQGFTVIIAGDKNHGEVTGIAGCAIDSQGNNVSILIENRTDAEKFIATRKKEGNPVPQKAVLISQTTISIAEYNTIAEVLRQEIPNLQVIDTICPATTERQNSLKDLEGKVDGVLIIGGKNSANTQRLLRSAKKIFEHAELIESAQEIPENFFTLKRIGLSAGASTPDEVIDEVEATLLETQPTQYPYDA